jgi:predicted dinucleotide-binding enzyme
MTTISIIGSGNMATAIGTRAAKHGHTIELISRSTAKAQAVADQIGNGATAMAWSHASSRAFQAHPGRFSSCRIWVAVSRALV